MANEQSQNGRGEYQIDEITYVKRELFQKRTYAYEEDGFKNRSKICLQQLLTCKHLV